MTQERRRPTMADVAALAGVSHQTVSRVMNDLPVVRPDTRDRVIEAAETLQYRRNSVARALATNQTHMIGVVASGTSWYGPASTLVGIQRAAREAQYLVNVVSLDTAGQDSVVEAIDVLGQHSPDGYVIVTLGESVSHLLELVTIDAPLVTVGSESGTLRTPSVGVDQPLGARLATEHLLGLGHRTVHHLAGPSTWLEAEARLEGWRSSLEAAGAPVPPVVRGDWTAPSGYEAAEALLAQPGVTAVFSANDHMALGFLKACSERGVRVPEDISVVGFDCAPESGFFAPPLTTVLQDFQAVGRTGIRLLLDMIEGRPITSSRSVIAPSLVMRSSTAGPTAHV